MPPQGADLRFSDQRPSPSFGPHPNCNQVVEMGHCDNCYLLVQALACLMWIWAAVQKLAWVPLCWMKQLPVGFSFWALEGVVLGRQQLRQYQQRDLP